MRLLVTGGIPDPAAPGTWIKSLAGGFLAQDRDGGRVADNDLKVVTKELGFNFDLENGGSHLDLSPQGKRAALAKAHLAVRKEAGQFFG